MNAKDIKKSIVGKVVEIEGVGKGKVSELLTQEGCVGVHVYIPEYDDNGKEKESKYCRQFIFADRVKGCSGMSKDYKDTLCKISLA